MDNFKEVSFTDPDSKITYKAMVDSKFYNMPKKDQDEYIKEVLLPAGRNGHLTSWGDTLKGGLGSVASGATLGFSKYVLPDSWNDATNRFNTEHPYISTATEIGGGLAAPLVAAAEAELLPEEAAIGGGLLAGTAGKDLLGNILKKAVVSDAVNNIAKGAVKEAAEKVAPKLSSKVVDKVGNLASSALQGGIYNYNTSDGDGATNFAQGAIGGGLLHGLGAGAKTAYDYSAGKVVQGIGNKLGINSEKNAANYLLKDAADHKSSPEELLNNLRNISNTAPNARVIDANPELLGSEGLLGNLAYPNQKLTDKVGRIAQSDLKNSDKIAQDIINNKLGNLDPDGISSILDDLTNKRKLATEDLYNKYNNSTIDLTSNDALFNNLVKNAEYSKYLRQHSGDYSGRDADLANISRLLENRNNLSNNSAVNKVGDTLTLNQLVADLDNKDANRAANDYLINLSKQSNLPFSTKGNLIADYIDNHLLKNEDVYSKQYKQLLPNSLSPQERQALELKAAIREVSPEYDAAQNKYRNYSLPINQIDLANSLGSVNTVNRLSEQSTANFNKMYNDLSNSISQLSDEDIKDIGKLAIRHSLQDLIDKKSNVNDVNNIAGLAKDVIGSNHINDRLSHVYGSDDIANLLNNLSLQDTINKERIKLNKNTNKRVAENDNEHLISSIPMPHRFIANLMKNYVVSPYKTSANAPAIVDLLLQPADKAIPVLEEAINKSKKVSKNKLTNNLSGILNSILQRDIAMQNNSNN